MALCQSIFSGPRTTSHIQLLLYNILALGKFFWFIIVLGGMTKNLYPGIFQKYIGFTVWYMMFFFFFMHIF